MQQLKDQFMRETLKTIDPYWQNATYKRISLIKLVIFLKTVNLNSIGRITINSFSYQYAVSLFRNKKYKDAEIALIGV